MTRSPRVWLAQALMCVPMVTALTGCALIAGVEEYELAPDAAGVRWPDSASPVPCTDGVIVRDPCPSAGEAGYGQDGHVSKNVPSYTTDMWTVTDHVTGLIWRGAPAPDPLLPQDAIAYCEALDDAAGNDWRLPSRLELVSLIDYGKPDPRLPDVFAPVHPMWPVAWWTSSPVPSDATHVWGVHLGGHGEVHHDPAAGGQMVLCVRGAPLVVLERTSTTFTIADPTTGFVWERNPAMGLDWLGALQYCQMQSDIQSAGYGDWRLPNIKELLTIVDDAAIDPAIDYSVFSGDLVDCYWSSTPDWMNPASSFVVSFSNGFAETKLAAEWCSARCVRGPD